MADSGPLGSGSKQRRKGDVDNSCGRFMRSFVSVEIGGRRKARRKAAHTCTRIEENATSLMHTDVLEDID